MTTRSSQSGQTRALLGAAILGLATLAGATGCATYANYPPIGQDLAINDPNVVPLPVLMRVATTRVLQRDAASGDLPDNWVLNLPRGMTTTRARSVLEGRVTHPDRASVAATLAPDPGGVAGEVLAGLVEPVSVTTRRFEELLRARCGSGTPVTDAEVAELLVGLRQGRCRSLVARHLRRDTARAQVDLWSEVVRRAPRDRVPDAAGAVALAAWVVGDGALAWCAVDRGVEVEPEHPDCAMVARLLQRAVSPEGWEGSLRPLAG